MKKLFPLIMLAIFAALLVSSCASNLQKALVIEDSTPAWVKGPTLYEDEGWVYAVAKFKGQNIGLARTAAETLARKQIAQYLKLGEDVSGVQIVRFWRDQTTGTTYALAKYLK